MLLYVLATQCKIRILELEDYLFKKCNKVDSCVITLTYAGYAQNERTQNEKTTVELC